MDELQYVNKREEGSGQESRMEKTLERGERRKGEEQQGELTPDRTEAPIKHGQHFVDNNLRRYFLIFSFFFFFQLLLIFVYISLNTNLSSLPLSVYISHLPSYLFFFARLNS